MSLFRTIVFVAAVAGGLAGLALTAIQHISAVPLILKAETYEKAKEAQAPAPGAGATQNHDATAAHDDEGWSPADGIERIAFSTLANVVGGIGLALLLVALSEIAGGITNWRQGIFWGLGGFAAFTLAPSLSMPPELPAMPTADLMARQIWWIATVALTAGGLALLVFRRTLWTAVLAIALIVAPHVVGVPKPESFETPIPHDLAQSFVVSVVISSLVFWVLLGGFSGYVRSRLTAAH
ncbi:MAG: CbtA family protein [Rhizobiales bacterium]|nr:CbtA family protein [Hyphomicrobiales bacterium]